jgi:hypothetical protein
MSVGLVRDELKALLDAAQLDGPRSEALLTLLAYNGLRIDEALSRDIEHLGHQLGHRVLRISRKGGRDALEPLSPPVERALDAHLAGRTAGALFLDDRGRRMYEAQAWRLVRRLARRAEIKSAAQLSPHSLRHTFATSLDHAGVPLQDIQDAMGHADPRTYATFDDNLASGYYTVLVAAVRDAATAGDHPLLAQAYERIAERFGDKPWDIEGAMQQSQLKLGVPLRRQTVRAFCHEGADGVAADTTTESTSHTHVRSGDPMAALPAHRAARGGHRAPVPVHRPAGGPGPL